MRILLTGMNKAQTHYDQYLNMALKVVTTQYGLTRALADMGHEIDQRPVTIGEDLSGYDKVIVFIHNPAGFAGYVYNALWAIHNRPDCILSVDDWQADGIYDGVCNLTNEDVLFRPFVKDAHVLIPENIEDYKAQLLEGVAIVAAGKNTMMVAGWKGGDISLMIPKYPKEKFMRYDLNPYNKNRTPQNDYTGDDDYFSMLGDSTVDPKDKLKEWTFASLMQGKTRKWLKDKKLQWDIKFFGAKGGEFKCERLKEPEMCARYASAWGVLVPKYYHAGSGFWRPRTLQTADAGSILMVDKAEGTVYSSAHIGYNTSDVEAMDLSQLTQLAKDQRDGLYDTHPLDKAVTRAELTAILES